MHEKNKLPELESSEISFDKEFRSEVESEKFLVKHERKVVECSA